MVFCMWQTSQQKSTERDLKDIYLGTPRKKSMLQAVQEQPVTESDRNRLVSSANAKTQVDTEA